MVGTINTQPEIRALLLAAGLGSRLKPLTDHWPKCLMPIGDLALLEYWLQVLQKPLIAQVLVNLHYHADQVERFLDRPRFSGWVDRVEETALLGTAGTIRANIDYFRGATMLLIHADNWCQCDLGRFVAYHQQSRPDHCLITMMTFDTDAPQTCGIVETDAQGVVIGFHEKVKNPPGNKANAAVYLLEPSVLLWLEAHPEISDFSTHVLPYYVGHIATWHNDRIHRDIGTLAALRLAQSDPKPTPQWPEVDEWQAWFLEHSVRLKI